MNNSITLGNEQLHRLFPFFIIVDKYLKIVDFGDSIAKMCSVQKDSDFVSCFSLQRPYHQIKTFDDLIALVSQFVVLQEIDKSYPVFKGQFEVIEDDSKILFVGTPWFGSMDQLTSAGLTVTNFAAHDPTVDFLHALKIQENVNEDIKQLLAKVSEQKNALKRLSLIAQKTQNAIIITNSDGLIEWVNEAFRTITGYSTTEVLNQKPGDILQGKDTDIETIRYMHNAIKQGLPFTCEVLNYHKNGSSYWVRITGQPLFDNKGNLTQYFAIEEDISESKRLAISINTTATRLKTLISSLSDAVLLESEDRKIELVNNRFCQIFNIPLSPDSLIGMDSKQAAEEGMLLYKDQEGFIQRIEEIVSNRQHVIADELELKDGRWIERDFIPIRDGERYLGHLWVFSDITDRKKYDSALQSQRQFYENILNKIPSDIAVFDKEQHYLFVNPVSISNSEVREWIIGKTDYDYCEQYDLPVSIADTRKILFNSVLQSKELKSWEEEVEGPGGNKEYYIRYMYPVLDAENNVTIVISYGFEITERKKAEKEIADALLQQQELNELKSRFVSMISHEFRTPLSTILSSTQLLERYWNTLSEEKRQKHLPKIETAVDRMISLLDDVLFIGRTDGNKVVLSPKQLDIRVFCTEMIEEISVSGYGTNRVVFDIEGNVDKAMLDEKLLRHILLNLLSNAHKYSPLDSPVDFKVQTNPNSIIFTVQDHGIGIPTEDLEHLFEAFHRATNVGNVQGTGLGLSIVKRSVDIHNGTITVRSEIGIGTTFTVIIPIVNNPA